jgi:hypothetical protein
VLCRSYQVLANVIGQTASRRAVVAGWIDHDAGVEVT